LFFSAQCIIEEIAHAKGTKIQLSKSTRHEVQFTPNESVAKTVVLYGQQTEMLKSNTKIFPVSFGMAELVR